MKKYNVAVVGATGAVGGEMIEVLEQEKLPIKKLVLLASKKSAGKTIEFNGEKIVVQELVENIFEQEKIDIALFSAGGSVSKKFAPIATKSKVVVIDNTSFFRMQEDVPLVVPEVNPEDIRSWSKTGIIANPNCSTIQMVMALKPLDDVFDIKRVNVSTYQAVSGTGTKAMNELIEQMKDVLNFEFENSVPSVYPYKIALNAIPQIDVFTDSGFTKEEEKMIFETQKILHKKIQVAATCVRVPILRGHSEAVSVTFAKETSAEEVRNLLKTAKGVVVQDEPENLKYPMPLNCIGLDETFVGRIKSDLHDKKIVHFWCVADNLRVGAASNAVKIAREWIKQNS